MLLRLLTFAAALLRAQGLRRPIVQGGQRDELTGRSADAPDLAPDSVWHPPPQPHPESNGTMGAWPSLLDTSVAGQREEDPVKKEKIDKSAKLLLPKIQQKLRIDAGIEELVAESTMYGCVNRTTIGGNTFNDFSKCLDNLPPRQRCEGVLQSG